MAKFRRSIALAQDFEGDAFSVDRQTFEVPPGHKAVRDEEGRATGETRLIDSAEEMESLDMAGIADEVAKDIHEPYVVRELLAKANVYRERNKLYGDNYKRFGAIMSLMLDGQNLDCRDHQLMNRLGVLVQVVAKMTRYGENFSRGGHNDSLDDISVYSMMLKELDNA